jgi:hypothetical protein
MEVEIRTDLPAKVKGGRKRAKDSNPQEDGLSFDIAPVKPREVQREEEISASANAPLVEVEVMRIAPNPRLLLCRYWVFGEERRALIRVHRNKNFKPGMKLSVKRPANGTEAEPWPYDGWLPRRPGRW